MVSDTHDDGDLVLTPCPHCGQASSLQPTETLSPQVCPNCQQIHVVTLKADDSTPTDDAAPPGIPTDLSEPFLGRIARYQVTTVLGSGAFGVVYKAWDPRLHRWVAIKVPKLATQRKQAVEDFLREARTAARLRHPRIVSVFDAEMASGRPFIVAEFVEGNTLASQLSSGTISPRKAARIVYELSMALHYAHQQGIVHRDIKPANVMIDAQGHPRLMDFGLAQLSTNLPATNDGKIAGTPAYMSPEMARGELRRAGSASDQYSLGVILFESLVGVRPFEVNEKFNGNLMGLIRRIGKETPPRMRSVYDDIPAELDEICARMTALMPEDRYRDLGAVAKDLITYLKPPTDVSIQTVDSQDSFFQSISNRVKVAAAGGIALLVILLVVFFRQGPHVEPVVVNPEPVLPVQESPAGVTVGTTAEMAISPDTKKEASPASIIQPDVVEPTNEMVDAAAAEEPPADALTAIETAEHDVLIPPLVDLKPTYPPIQVDGGPDQLTLFRTEFETLLTTGFPENAHRLDDQGFAKVLKHYSTLAKLAPKEPRVPFALAIIRSTYNPGKGTNRNELPVERELLEQSLQLGGYSFTPGYLALIKNQIRAGGKTAPLASAMNSLAIALTKESAWPDKSEKHRILTWMGTVYGYYTSGCSGKDIDEQTMKASLEKVRSLLDESEIRSLADSILQTELRISANEDAIDEAVQKYMADKLGKAAKSVANEFKGMKFAAELLVDSAIELSQLETKMAELKPKFEAEFLRLTQALATLSTAEKIALQESLTAATEVNSMNALIDRYTTEANNGDPTNSGQLQILAQSLPVLHRKVAKSQLELSAISFQKDLTERGLYQLGRAAAAIEQFYFQKKGVKSEEMGALSRKINLHKQAASSPQKEVKLPDFIIRRRRTAKEIRTWVDASNVDAKAWLRHSLQAQD